MTRTAAINAATAYFEDGRFQSELATLVAYPTESQNPDAAPELMRYLKEAIQPRLEKMGFATEILDNPDPRGGPLLIGERREGDDLTTVLTYGHGDVIRAQDGMWREGLTPFELIEEGDRLYGRGSADNKVQHLINIAALESVLAVRGSLGFNVRIVLEMSEEVGSSGLADVFRNHKDRLTADVLIASDGPRLQPEVPTIFMGSRGGTTFDLELDLRDGAHHSGNWGGFLPIPRSSLPMRLRPLPTVAARSRCPNGAPTA